MSDKKRGTDAECNAELMRNLKGWVLLLTTYYLLLTTFAGCKKAIPSEPETKINYGAFYTDGLSSKKWVSLTFDDGPNSQVIEKIFEILKKENVKATFFLLGVNIKKHPQYVDKYLQSGHEIGNHTYSHKNFYELTKTESLGQLEKILSRELEDCETAIKDAVGIKPLFMRMPNGYISPTVKKTAMEKEYVIVNWTFGCDWHKNSKEELVRKYLKSVEPGAIFLFHEKKFTAEALPEIISGIKKKGYEIVTLREILGLEENKSTD